MLETTLVRRGTPDDLDRFATHWLDMFEEVGKLFEPELPSDWRTRFVTYFQRRMLADEAAFFVAECDGDVVATAGALLRDGYPAAIDGFRYGYIFGVRVDPRFRRRGLAERLTREAISYLHGHNCRNIRLHASRFGRPIYERIGFEPTNEMQLNLQPA